MTTVALQEALRWHDELMDREHKGRRDKESAARSRLAEKTGVPESYLFRLAHKRRDMRDVAGEVYRRLQQSYILLCEKTEAAADALEARRLGTKAQKHAVVESSLAAARRDMEDPSGRETAR